MIHQHISCHVLLLRFLLNVTSSALLSSTSTTQLIWLNQRSTSFCVISTTSMSPRIQEMVVLPSWFHYHLKINNQLTLSRSKFKFWAATLVSKLNPSFKPRRLAKFSLQKRRSPVLSTIMCVVYKFKCDQCDADYVGYTARDLHQRSSEHKYSAIGRHLKQQVYWRLIWLTSNCLF